MLGTFSIISVSLESGKVVLQSSNSGGEVVGAIIILVVGLIRGREKRVLNSLYFALLQLDINSIG